MSLQSLSFHKKNQVVCIPLCFFVTVAPTTVTLTLVFVSGEEAAIDASTELTADQDVSGATLTVINGNTHEFTAATDAVDPQCQFVWERRMNAGTPAATMLSPGTLPDQTANGITCTATASTDTYSHTMVYDVDDDQVLFVSADNNHNAVAVTQTVTLDIIGKLMIP